MVYTGQLLKQASNQLTKNFDHFAKQFGLTAMQMSIIDFIGHDEGEYSQNDIEQEFHIQRSTTTVLLQRMEKKGLIERRLSAQDARKKIVSLTPAAKKIVDKCQLYIQEQENQLAAHFTKQELEIFRKILSYYKN